MQNSIEAELLKNKALLFVHLVVLLSILTLCVACFGMDQPDRGCGTDTPWCGTEARPEQASESYARGRQLFLANCASCHNQNMKDNLTGPALGGVAGRWAAYPRKDLYNWIRGSQKMIAARHPKAVTIWKSWRPSVMNDFPHLNDSDIEDLLVYIGD